MSHAGIRTVGRKGIVLAAVAVAAAAAAGCSGPSSSGAATGGAKKKAASEITIGYVTKSASNQGWVIINQGAADAAKEAGVKLVTVGPDQAESLSGQQAAIENMVNRKVDGLALAPVDSAAVAPSVEKANAAGIPVVAVDTAVTGAPVASYVATDNLKAGTLQGQWAAQNVADDAEVIVVNGMLSQSTGRERFDGFEKALKATKPNVRIYQVQTKWDQTEAQNGVEALLSAHPNVSLIANAWDGATMGSIAAAQAKGKGKGQLKVIGIDGDPLALKAMKDGWVQADIGQRLYQEGYQGVMTAIKAARGEQVDKRIDTGEAVITPDNVDDFIAKNHLSGYVK